eukprot:46388-Eustigmatos_ZCMA.PRE.1
MDVFAIRVSRPLKQGATVRKEIRKHPQSHSEAKQSSDTPSFTVVTHKQVISGHGLQLVCLLLLFHLPVPTTFVITESAANSDSNGPQKTEMRHCKLVQALNQLCRRPGCLRQCG